MGNQIGSKGDMIPAIGHKINSFTRVDFDGRNWYALRFIKTL
jgi:hypothetical protein